MRKTRNAIISSVVAIVLCIAMLSGSTFAWFTDTASSSGNIVQSGKFDVAMYWSSELLDVDSNQWIDASSGPVFTYNNWEPGYTDVKYIKVANEGELNLKWKLSIEADGQVSSISDVIDVYYVNPVANELTSLNGLTSVGTLTEVLANKTNSSGSLTPGQSVILAIAFHMDEEAGNEYQGMSLCDEGFSLKLLAAQDIGEGDAFGDEYDKDATWEETVINFSASTSLSGVPLIYGALANEVTIGSASGINATLPADVKIENGATSLGLAVSKVDTGSNITLGEGESARSLDVHISGIASDNTVPMKVYLGAIMEKNLADTEVKLYHIENGTPVLMTRVNSVSDFAIHNQYTYDPATGEVTIFVASFSVFTAVNTAADEWDGTVDTDWYTYNPNNTVFTLETAEQFAGFRDLVDGGNTFEGKTVILATDIDLSNKPFDPIGFGYWYEKNVVEGKDKNTVFMGTFDGQGHTIYNLYQNGWELDPDKENYSTYTYSTAGAGLFASIKNATIKNLAVSGAEIVFECVDMGVVVGYAQGSCHFENIVVTDSKIANYNRYTGGVVGEVSYGPYGIDTSLGYSHTFKNVTVDSSVTVSGLWGSFGCGMGGVIGGKWGDATVKMENVVSAPTMDVYNDVVSAYQWYAFRGCGMLIGHTEEPYSDGRHSGNATASFLTCVNVNVYYGDWTKYNYYEFANQDNATGRNYPWVRAEEGNYCDAFSNIRYGVPTHDGVKVSDLTEEELKDIATNYTPIVFDQLYGADRGMYGTNKHEGVNVSYSSPKTFYIKNNAGWKNLKLHYIYEIGEETWTTIPDGVELVEFNGVYRIDLPVGAKSFTITADGNYTSKEFIVSELTEKETYLVHEHNFVDDKCDCGATKITSNVNILDYANANGWVNDKQYKEIVIGGIKVTATGGGNTGKYYTSGNNWRIYQSENATVVINSESCNIVSAKITYVLENTGVLTYNGSNVESGMLVDVNANSITFAVGNTGSATNGQVRITAIEVVYILENHECNQNEDVKGKDATCTETGLTDGAKCDICGKITLEQKIIPVGDHAWNDATCTSPQTCSVCGATEGHSLGHTTENGVCENCGQTIGGTTPAPETPTESGWIETELANIKPTDVVVIVWKTSNGTAYAISNDRGTGSAPDAVVVTVDGNKLTGEIADNIKWNISNNNGNLTIYPDGTTATWLYCTSTNNGVRVGTNNNKVFTIDAASGYLKHTGTSRYLGVYTSKPDVRCYTNTTGNTANQTLAFYKYTEGGSEGGETPNPETCTHENTTPTTVDATCTSAGSITVTCDDCSAIVSEETIDAKGHNYIDGTCSTCGAQDPNAGGSTEPTETTVQMNIYATTGTLYNKVITWTSGDVAVSNAQASSTNAIRTSDSDHHRVYAKSEVTISANGGKITQVVITCTSSDYANVMKTSAVNAGYTATVNGSVVTITVDNTESITFTASAQTRMSKIVVTYTK